MLVYTALLSMFFWSTYLIGRTMAAGGLDWAFGNRDVPLAVPAWTARAQRAHANLVENLAPFAILVLVAHVAGKANAPPSRAAVVAFGGGAGTAGMAAAGHIKGR